MCQCEAEVDYVDKEETDYLPEAGKVVAALPLLDMGGGDVVDQVFLFRELASTVAPFASKHTSALNSELLIVNKSHLLDAFQIHVMFVHCINLVLTWYEK